MKKFFKFIKKNVRFSIFIAIIIAMTIGTIVGAVMLHGCADTNILCLASLFVALSLGSIIAFVDDMIGNLYSAEFECLVAVSLGCWALFNAVLSVLDVSIVVSAVFVAVAAVTYAFGIQLLKDAHLI